ncbi:hypothetical protein VCHA40P240_10239 [Vibrio chagasii]|nr:hypothetical protein VCHA40P240_10239 [Vibrio chagasii]
MLQPLSILLLIVCKSDLIGQTVTKKIFDLNHLETSAIIQEPFSVRQICLVGRYARLKLIGE